MSRQWARSAIAAMIYAGMVAKMVCSFPRSSDTKSLLPTAIWRARSSWSFVPQGTLAERIRAAGAGHPGLSTPRRATAPKSPEGKPVEEFDGKHYVRERWLKADVAIIKGRTGRP